MGKRIKSLVTAVAVAAFIIVSVSGVLYFALRHNSSAGANNSNNINVGATATPESVTTGKLDIENMFSSRDKEVGYDESTAVAITLSDTTAQCSSESVSISKGQVTIKAAGVYLISGNIKEGQIVVDVAETEKVQLVLKEVSISNSSTAPIYVKNGDKVFVTLAQDSKNSLSVTGEFKNIDDNNIDSVIFSKSDLTLNGNGNLSINTSYGHGVVSKDDLVITSGTYEINASGHGLAGNDSVRIADGSFTITSGKDGIHSENKDDANLGYVYIAQGTFNINAKGDGIDGAYVVQADNGTFNIKTGDGSANANVNKGNEKPGFGMRPDFDNMQKENQSSNTENNGTAVEETSTVSQKGIKSNCDIIINQGKFTIDSYDDSLHANKNVVINHGEISIAAGDDAIHANLSLAINDGNINITKSYEGLEGQNIYIAGGNTTVVASDDGLNAAEASASTETASSTAQSGNMEKRKNDFESNANCFIKITGGTLKVNADGDGIDSNGNLYVIGGTTYVWGPTNNGNGALDYAGSAEITGGTFIAAGSSGMAQNFGSTSTQGSMLVNSTSSQSGEIVLMDESGSEIIKINPKKQYNSVVISTPKVQKGKNYTLTMGNDNQSVNMTDIIYGGGNGGMGGGMRPGGGKGEMQLPEGQKHNHNKGENEQQPNGGAGQTPQDNMQPSQDKVQPSQQGEEKSQGSSSGSGTTTQNIPL